MSKKIRKGDRVLVIAGNEQGKTGEVLLKREDRVVVKGINVRKKHLPRTQQMQGGRIIEKEMPIHISNVVVCTKDGQKMKLRVKESEEGKRELVFRIDGKETLYRPVRKPA